MKYWEQLLLSQRNRGKNGLTIPFIIGSQNFLNTDKKDNIEELILDILKNSSFEITLRLCADIHTLILEKRNPNNVVYYPSYNNIEQSKFSVSKSFKDDFGNTVEEVIIILTNQFKKIIDDKTFSAQSSQDGRIAKWKFFSNSEDIPFLVDCFKNLK
jgi:hypothetical protein